MSEPLTQFGINKASLIMQSFHELGNKTLKELLDHYSAPENRKTLRTWGISEAAKMIGRTEQHIRNLEKPGGKLFDSKSKTDSTVKKRSYSLKRINEIRDALGTRFCREDGSEPIILAVSNFKGGVAKSTTTLHLAQKCALEGLRILCIDLDPQATLTLNFGFIPDIHLDAGDTICDALSQDSNEIHKLIKNTYFDGISIIPGNLALADMELVLSNVEKQKPLIKELGMPHERLKKALNLVKDNYDIIILDCGPNLGILTINAVTAANSLLVPIPPMMPDFGSYVTFTGTLSTLFESINKDFDFFRLLITKHPNSNESKAIEHLMRSRFGRYMLNNHIVNSVEIEKASAQFSSVYEMPKQSSEAYKRALNCLNKVIDEILTAFKEIWTAQAIAKNTISPIQSDFMKNL